MSMDSYLLANKKILDIVKVLVSGRRVNLQRVLRCLIETGEKNLELLMNVTSFRKYQKELKDWKNLRKKCGKQNLKLSLTRLKMNQIKIYVLPLKKRLLIRKRR